VADWLVAWLYDTPVAVLVRGPEFRIRLEWRPEGIERWGLGSPALSVGLPIGAPVGPRDTRGLDFFENILPEGPALERMAALARVRPVDTYGILAAFGRAMAANKATCLRLAAACGLPVPQADLLDVAGLPVLAVKRYDRQDAPAGDIPVRVHQEDGCQATATPPGLKYEEQGGPALRDFADVIREQAERISRG
jgi:HipA-like protein